MLRVSGVAEKPPETSHKFQKLLLRRPKIDVDFERIVGTLEKYREAICTDKSRLCDTPPLVLSFTPKAPSTPATVAKQCSILSKQHST